MNQRENQTSLVVEYAASPQPGDLISEKGRLARKFVATPTLLSRALARPAISAEQAAQLRGVPEDLASSRATREAAQSSLDDFLRTTDLIRELELWFGAETLLAVNDIGLLQAQIQRDIAWIDHCLSAQINQVLHHPDFQKLEASWRGLAHLVNCQERWSTDNSTIKVLNASWRELRSDFENATDYDQSDIYWKIHQEGIGQAGAFPFSAVLLDYSIHPMPTREHPCDDIEVLTRLAEVGQAAFCPMIANADPTMFDEESFCRFASTQGCARFAASDQDPYDALHNSLSFFRWKKFRGEESARFMSLAMPRMLMRRPYRASQMRYFGFGFDEEVRSSRDYLWGGAAFAMGEVLLRAFSEGSWFADIRGAQRGSDHGGRVLGPTYDVFQTEPRDVASKPVTEIVISDDFERSLSRLALCLCVLAKIYLSLPSTPQRQFRNQWPTTMSMPASTRASHRC